MNEPAETIDPAFEHVTDWLHRHTGVNRETLSPGTKLDSILTDPLDLVTFVLEVEADLGLTLPPFDQEGEPESVTDLADWIRRAREG